MNSQGIKIKRTDNNRGRQLFDHIDDDQHKSSEQTTRHHRYVNFSESLEKGVSHPFCSLIHTGCNLPQAGFYRIERHSQKTNHIGEYESKDRSAPEQAGGESEGRTKTSVHAVSLQPKC